MSNSILNMNLFKLLPKENQKYEFGFTKTEDYMDKSILITVYNKRNISIILINKLGESSQFLNKNFDFYINSAGLLFSTSQIIYMIGNEVNTFCYCLFSLDTSKIVLYITFEDFIYKSISNERLICLVFNNEVKVYSSITKAYLYSIFINDKDVFDMSKSMMYVMSNENENDKKSDKSRGVIKFAMINDFHTFVEKEGNSEQSQKKNRLRSSSVFDIFNKHMIIFSECNELNYMNTINNRYILYGDMTEGKYSLLKMIPSNIFNINNKEITTKISYSNLRNFIKLSPNSTINTVSLKDNILLLITSCSINIFLLNNQIEIGECDLIEIVYKEKIDYSKFYSTVLLLGGFMSILYDDYLKYQLMFLERNEKDRKNGMINSKAEVTNEVLLKKFKKKMMIYSIYQVDNGSVDLDSFLIGDGVFKIKSSPVQFLNDKQFLNKNLHILNDELKKHSQMLPNKSIEVSNPSKYNQNDLLSFPYFRFMINQKERVRSSFNYYFNSKSKNASFQNLKKSSFSIFIDGSNNNFYLKTHSEIEFYEKLLSDTYLESSTQYSQYLSLKNDKFEYSNVVFSNDNPKIQLVDNNLSTLCPQLLVHNNTSFEENLFYQKKDLLLQDSILKSLNNEIYNENLHSKDYLINQEVDYRVEFKDNYI